MEAVLKTALVTGASRGIGRAIALQLASDGFKVFGCARGKHAEAAPGEGRPGEGPPGEEAPGEGAPGKGASGEGRPGEGAPGEGSPGGAIEMIDCDVADEASVEAMFLAIERAHGRLDALVNNAGIFDRAPLGEMSAARFDRVMAVNVRGVFLCCRAAFRVMARQPEGGDIVNVSSLAGVKGVEKFSGTSAYVASKYAVAGLTEQLASEGKPLNIRVKAISPGAVDTEMLAGSGTGLRAGITAAQLARVVSFLVSEDGRPLGGSNVEIFSNA